MNRRDISHSSAFIFKQDVSQFPAGLWYFRLSARRVLIRPGLLFFFFILKRDLPSHLNPYSLKSVSMVTAGRWNMVVISWFASTAAVSSGHWKLSHSVSETVFESRSDINQSALFFPFAPSTGCAQIWRLYLLLHQLPSFIHSIYVHLCSAQSFPILSQRILRQVLKPATAQKA